MDMNFDLYMNNIVKQARSEMDHAGYEQLATEEDVDRVFKQDGTTLVMINSVCGCAGGIARPAATHALHYDVLPDRLVTVFAVKIRKQRNVHVIILKVMHHQALHLRS